MMRYEEHIKSIFIAANSDSYQSGEKDSDYFIREYGGKFRGRESNNIKNRLELYNEYLGKRED